jgi:hypothetical protein
MQDRVGDEGEVTSAEGRGMKRGLAPSREGVQHLHAGLIEIARVPRGDGEIVLERIDRVSYASLGTLMSSFVSLRSIGSNQPLTGQASRSFTKPSLRRRSFRFSRYSRLWSIGDEAAVHTDSQTN